MNLRVSTPVLPRSTPESVGLPPSQILDFLDSVRAREIELHSLMLMRKGQVVAEGWWRPYRKDDRHLLYSLSKSFTSTAIGFAIHEGLLGLDDLVVSFFPDEVDGIPSENLAKMRVRHLLSMSSGHGEDPLADLGARGGRDWPRPWLNAPIPFEPGTHFLYNSGATFMLSAILQRLSGKTTLEYLEPRLLEPLGIKEAAWETNKDGIVVGGWGMSLTTESVAKFGHLYLRDGVWEGRQILPVGWVSQATTSYIDNSTNEEPDWKQGYGFQFWRGQHGSYRGDGAFGQFCVVMPELDMVVAITACVDSMQDVLNLVWEHLLPGSASTHEHFSAQSKLDEVLRDLELCGPDGKAASPLELGISSQTFNSVENGMFARMCWTFSEPGCVLSLEGEGGEQELRAGRKSWSEPQWLVENGSKKKVSAQSAWASEDTHVTRIRFLEEPASLELRANFREDGLSVTSHWRGKFGDPDGPHFKGVVEKS